MALVKCPECGKENISDSAVTCPSCGYAIKDHFEQVKQEKAFIEQKRQKQESLQRELEKKLKEIDDMPHPSKPSISDIFSYRGIWAFLVFCFLALFLILCVVFLLFIGGIGGSIVLLLIGGFCGALSYSYGKDIKEEYENALNKYRNWDRYKEKLKNNAKNLYETRISDLKKQEFEVQKSTVSPEKATAPQPSYGLKCPVCGSPRVKRISNTSRAISVELMGLASSKIGRQYECQSCKHKW